MKLYLLRHAEAGEAKTDFDRHLTSKGRRDAKSLGKELGRYKLRLKTIWHSGVPRAIETAEAVARHLRGKPRLIKHNGLAGNDSVSKAAKQLARVKGDIMMVGHEPFLGKLTAQLVLLRSSPVPVHLRKPSVVCLERGEDESWRIGWMLPVKV